MALSSLKKIPPSAEIPVSAVTTEFAQINNVTWNMLRFDQIDPLISGNKFYKLQPYIEQMAVLKKTGIVSFGGAHSNHLHALAAAGKKYGFTTIGYIQAYPEQTLTPTMLDLKAMGMELVLLDKTNYRQRNNEQFLAALQQKHPSLLIVREGGSGKEGIEGAALMAEEAKAVLNHLPDFIALASGTGTTFAGFCQAFAGQKTTVMSVCALKNAVDIQRLVTGQNNMADNIISEEFTFGGFAKCNDVLTSFMEIFERNNGFLLDPVYTAKLCYGVNASIENGLIPPGSNVVTIHTGGLQGRRGMGLHNSIELVEA